MKYRCVNYWHSPILQVMPLEVLFTYEMYLEVAEGELDRICKDDDIVDFWKFCALLSNQMIKYKPNHHTYAGDANMRPATK